MNSDTPSGSDQPLPFPRLEGYVLVSRLGGGGMGDVYKAREPALDRFVALKVLPADLARQPEFVERFRREAAAAARVVHPNVVPIYQIGEAEGKHFFAMQLVEGESLADLLARTEKLPLVQALQVAGQVLAGLSAAHLQGLVHRDIKPGNVLLDRESRRAKLADFGLAKAIQVSGAESLTATGVILGTLEYASPEQVRGLPVDGRSDLYSAGVLLYRMLAGRLPFESEDPIALIFQQIHEPPPELCGVSPEVPREVAAFVAKLLAKSPGDRPQTAQAARDELEDLAKSAAPVAVPTGNWKRLMKLAAVGLLLVATCVGAWRITGWLREFYRTPEIAQKAQPPAIVSMILTMPAVDRLSPAAVAAPVLTVAIRDGEWVAPLSADPLLAISRGEGGVELVSLETGKSLSVVKPASSGSHLLAALPGGTYATLPSRTSRQNAALKVWKASDTQGAPRGTLPDGEMLHLAAAPDGALLAMATREAGNTVVRCWDAGAGRETWKQAIPDLAPAGLAFSADGRHLLIPRRLARVELRSRETGSLVRTLVATSPGKAASELVALAVDGMFGSIVTADQAGAVRFWSSSSFVLEGELPPDAGSGAITRIALDSGGRRLAVSRPNAIAVWDLCIGYRRLVLDAGHPVDMAFEPGGNRLVVLRAADAQIWDTSFPVVKLAVREGTPTPPQSSAETFAAGRQQFLAEVSPDGRHIASQGGSDRPGEGTNLSLWDSSGRRLHRIPVQGMSNHSQRIRFVPNSRWIAVCGLWGFRLVDRDTGEVVNRFPLVESMVRSFDVSPDGKLLALGLENEQARSKSIAIYDVDRAEVIRTIPVEKADEVCFVSGGRRVLVAHPRTVLDAVSGEVLHSVNIRSIDSGTGELRSLDDRRVYGTAALNYMSPAKTHRMLVDASTGESVLAADIANGNLFFSYPEWGIQDPDRNAIRRGQPPVSGDPVTRSIDPAVPDVAVAPRPFPGKTLETKPVHFLKSAREELERSGTTDAFQADLQGASPHLAELPVATDGPLKWAACSLNALPEFLDAFRLKNPLDVPADLYWTFWSPAGAHSLTWYIHPARGSMDGFESFRQRSNLDVPQAGIPPQNTLVFQGLTGGRLQPGQEAVVWFKAKAIDPREIRLAIRIVPADPTAEAVEPDDIAAKLKLPLKPSKLPQTTENLSRILNEIHGLASDGHWTSEPVLARLRLLLPALPQVEISGEGPAAWSTVKPLVPGASMTAVRFKAPSKPGRLLSAAISRGEAWYCAVASASGEAVALSGGPLFDVHPPGVAAPAGNLAFVHGQTDSLLVPGEEYILCYGSRNVALGDLQVSLRALPADEPAGAHPVWDLAAEFGITRPAAPTSDARAVALRTLAMSMLLQDEDELDAILESDPRLWPELPQAAGDGALPWAEGKIDRESTPVAAFRLVPGNVPSDLFLLLMTSGGVDVGFRTYAPVRDRAQWLAYQSPLQENSRPVSGIEIPQGLVLRATSATNVLPNVAPVVCLTLGKKRAPFDYKIVARLAPAGSVPLPHSYETIVRAAGIRPPPAKVSNGGRRIGQTLKAAALAFRGDGSWTAATSAGNALTFGPDLRMAGAPVPVPEGVRVLQAAETDLLALVVDSKNEASLQSLTGKGRIAAWNALEGDLQVAAVSPTGRHAAALVRRGQGNQGYISDLVVWEVGAAAPRTASGLRTMALNAIAFSPDGKTLLTGGGSQTGRSEISSELTLWNLETLQPEFQHRDADSGITAAAFSRDGRRFATGSFFGFIKLWDTASRKVLSSIALDLRPQKLACSPDGQRVAIAGDDPRVRLWDVETRRIVADWQGHAASIEQLAMSPDGASVVSSDGDGTVIQWTTAAAFEDKTGKPQDPALRTPVANSLGMTLVPLTGGTFEMGTPLEFKVGRYRTRLEDERPLHEVTITRPYYLAAHEVTVGQFREFVKASGYRTTAEIRHNGETLSVANEGGWVTDPKLTWQHPGFPQDDRHPVVLVSRIDALKFCEWLSTTEKARYRLPTEAEWEFACRAGNGGDYAVTVQALTYGRAANVADQGLRDLLGTYDTALFARDGHPYSAPVGSYPPNGFGLYDLHGNVFEWMSDVHDPLYYRLSPPTDPAGPKSGTNYAQRGGCFFYHYLEVRSGGRDYGPEEQAQSSLGFRVLREFDKP